jgi:hypothetical protein
MLGSQGSNSFRRGAPLIMRQFSGGNKGAIMQSNTGLYVALAAIGAGGGYYFFSKSGSVDYQQVLNCQSIKCII